MFKKNLEKLKQDLRKNNIDLAIITDDDSIYYLTGYFDFLHMSFGRPTILLVPKDADTLLITPLIDAHLVKENCPVDKIITWNDGVDNEWREELPKYIKKNDRDNFLDNIDTIEIYKGNFNEIAILRKK